MKYALWTAQVLLALMFAFAGGFKLFGPAEPMNRDRVIAWPVEAFRAIGFFELLGALGMILPGLLRIKPGLTPLAAVGFLLIMSGAIPLTIMAMGVGPAVGPMVLWVLALFVAYGRFKVLPLQGK
ncbi:MAG TPA: DoxX family protein [bacterium]